MDLKEKLSFVSTSLGLDDYFVDNKFSIVDMIIGITINTVQYMKLLEDFPKLQSYVNRISSRDAFKRAYAPEESVEIRQLKAQVRKMKTENLVLKGEIKPQKVTIFHFPGSRSSRCVWLLEELGIEYEFVDLKQKGVTYIKSEEYVAVNPNGLIPALLDGDLKYFEGGSIIQYVLKKYPKEVKKSGLIPEDWKEENIKKK